MIIWRTAILMFTQPVVIKIIFLIIKLHYRMRVVCQV